ncbi:mitogen-activated protein kinase kinase kinase 18 [Brachypodium distachyon]|uniref:mitogen-activated protein kinase kinase kinase 18 n=1 Tax=Brachypodium distachyon TaxID=15368 RepID=UPI0001C7293B|nr:mitogen-activated protein kinase kinase kinase 18 [Brachypodium distachyon]|eukprot:XP_024315893.1 mitogen-activated protein kinase kinase kinase 18 [Brachypodium distachyon]
MDTAVSGRWTRVRTLGRGASGAVVSLAAADLSGALFAVKSARAAGAEQLRREGDILSGLSSPHVLPCLGFRADSGECQLFLEFAPGGSVADVAERSGGRLEECAIRAYAADVARGLAYLHGMSLVHGDLKGRNVVVGADGRAKLADFGCARTVDSDRPIGGTPAFMAPEVARGEEQGPAADVWALGCTVVEMATGRAPWSDMDDVLAAMHRIGYTDAVPEVPGWLSAEAKHFLAMCFARDARNRCTAAQLLEHPFLALAGCGVKPDEMATKWVSPKSTLDAALWESDTEEEEENSESPAERIKALASTCSAFPDWDSDESWIDVLNNERCEASDAVAPADKAGEDECVLGEALETEADFTDAYVEDAGRGCAVGLIALSIELQKEFSLGIFSDPTVFSVNIFDECEITKSLLAKESPLLLLIFAFCSTKLNDFLNIGNDLTSSAELVRCDDSRNIVRSRDMHEPLRITGRSTYTYILMGPC